MELSKVLDSNHPSFGCGQAYFQFAIQSADKSVRKILLVEAINAHAVACLEYILGLDGRVSDTCHVICVARNSDDFAYRSDLIEPCAYADFLLDIVDSDRLLKDPVACHLFSESLTPEEKKYVSQKVDFQENSPELAIPVPQQTRKKATKKEKSNSVPQGEREDTIISAMTKLGFQKPNVVKWVEDKGPTLYEGPIQDRIREAISALAS